jgi:hypothetical protein
MNGSHPNGSFWPHATRDFRGTTAITPASGAPLRPITPEERARRQVEAGITQCVRVIARAVPGKKLAVFRQQAQEAFRLAARGGGDLEKVGDRLYDAGADLAEMDNELGDGWQDKLTAALSKAKGDVLTPASIALPTLSQPAATTSGERALIVRRASDVAPEKIEWLWPGRVAVGKLTLIGGTPGLGKSQLTVFVAKAVSTGGLWPCSEGRAPLGSVILFSAEDGLADTIIPRLTMAGADLGRVHVATGVQDKGGRRGFDLKADIAALEKTAKELGDVRLIVVDPISAYMGGATDGNDNVKTRNVLEPVSEMADRLRIAVVAVTHLSKSGGGGQSALNRFIGSIAFVAAARAAFAVIEDVEDKMRRLFLQVKNNLAKEAPGLAFRIEQAMLPGTDILASGVCFDSDPVEISANDALTASEGGVGGEGDRSNKDEAADFLRAVLAGGPEPVKEIERQAIEASLLGDGKPIGDSKVFRLARKKLGVKSHRQGGAAGAGQWVWELPGEPKAPQESLRRPTPGEGALANSGRLSGQEGGG